jgi:hypothetical protein
MYTNYFRKDEKKLSEMHLVERGTDMHPLLYDLLTTQSCRSFGEDNIIQLIKDFIPKTANGNIVCHEKDEKGNFFVRVGKQKKVHMRNKWTSDVMFSSHLDTVDSSNRGVTRELYENDGWIRCGITKDVRVLNAKGVEDTLDQDDLEKLVKKECGMEFDHFTVIDGKLKGSDDPLFEDWTDIDLDVSFSTLQKLTKNILGADDKLGCYIMCRMIEKGIPGLYAFHHAEESGRIGSEWIVENTPEILKGIKYCVAFDRADYSDIITRQMASACCSKEFANGLCEAMNPVLPPKQQMSPSPNGSFTDSASYTGLIPECTNISVGYKSQHSSSETFDHEWLEQMLLPALFQVKWSSLPVKRDPKEKEINRFGYSRHSYGMGYGNYPYGYDDDEFTANSPSYAYDEERGKWGRSSTSLTSSSASIKSFDRDRFKDVQSASDRYKHAVANVVPFDPMDGFYEKESEEMKINRVLLTIAHADMSMTDIAKLVIEAYETEPEDSTRSSYPW